jgi:hypothetical protein
MKNLNKMQDDIKFNKRKIISLVLDYCKEMVIVPSDYTPSKWEKIVKSYQPDMFQDFHDANKWESSDSFLNNMLKNDAGIDKEEISQLCASVYKRSIASHMVMIDLTESKILENERIYKRRLDFLEDAKLYRLEQEDYDEEQLVNFNITIEREKYKLLEEFNRVQEKLGNSLIKLNGLSMHNLHAIGYTQDLQRALHSKNKDTDYSFEIVEYKGKNFVDG